MCTLADTHVILASATPLAIVLQSVWQLDYKGGFPATGKRTKCVNHSGQCNL